jgi:gamma-glutamyltranspeptidase/glutathione hydrolase
VIASEPAPRRRPRVTLRLRLLALLLALAVAPATAAIAGSRTALAGTAEAGRRGAVAAEHPRAAEIGVDILRRGGNAVDAAIAVSYAVCVLHPSSCGIGGGGFMLVHEANGTVHALDYRETAPGLAHRDLYRRGDTVLGELARTGGLAVAVPGEVAGLEAARRRFARLPRAALMAPAIALARDGFPVSAHLASAIADNATAIRAVPELAALLLDADGRPLAEGATLRLPGLAATLERIAAEGAEAFYRGPVAAAIVRAVRGAGGIVTAEDLGGYRPRWREALRAAYRGFEIFTMPPPSSGGVVVEILQILAGDDLPALGPASAAYLHLLAEAMKHGFADRARWYGDPAFTRVPVARLTAPARGRELRARIAPDRTLAADRYGSPVDAGTAHHSIVGGDGTAVACTTTINTAFGAMLVAGDTGILLNNEMGDFALAPGVPNVFGLIGAEANAVEPGKRPLSSMTPLVARRDGRPRVVAGGSGGPLIVSGVLQALLGIVDFGLAPAAAVAAPRIHDQWAPPVLGVEAGIDAAAREELARRGHAVRVLPFAGAVQVVAVAPDGTLHPAADPRKGGGGATW